MTQNTSISNEGRAGRKTPSQHFTPLPSPPPTDRQHPAKLRAGLHALSSLCPSSSLWRAGASLAPAVDPGRALPELTNRIFDWEVGISIESWPGGTASAWDSGY